MPTSWWTWGGIERAVERGGEMTRGMPRSLQYFTKLVLSLPKVKRITLRPTRYKTKHHGRYQHLLCGAPAQEPGYPE